MEAAKLYAPFLALKLAEIFSVLPLSCTHDCSVKLFRNGGAVVGKQGKNITSALCVSILFTVGRFPVPWVVMVA